MREGGVAGRCGGAGRGTVLGGLFVVMLLARGGIFSVSTADVRRLMRMQLYVAGLLLVVWGFRVLLRELAKRFVYTEDARRLYLSP